MLSFQSLDFRCLGCRMPVSMYCQSTFLDALAKSHQPLLPGVSKYAVKAPSIWGSYTCQVSPNVLSKYQQSGGVTLILACLDFHCTVRVPSFPVWGCCLYCQSTTLMHLKSHINRCCQVSPNMLSKHHQSVSWNYTCLLLVQVSPNVLSEYQQSAWGSYTCLLLVLDWAQLILHLSRWAAVAGLRFVWGSHFLFHCQVSLLYCQVLSCEVTLVAVSKYLLGSASWFLLKELLLSVKPVSSSSYLPSHFSFHLRLYKCWGLINKIPTGWGEK